MNYFDLIIGGIVLLLGLKGILNGFFKEVFGLVGIVGGVFVASRFAHEVGLELSNAVFHFQNDSAINFTGFLVTLATFWALMVVVGMVFKKLVSASGLGIFDKILGFVFGASKFFLIVSVILYAANNIKFIHENLQKPMQNSFLFPLMVQTGSYIMKLDPVDHVEQLKQKQEEIQESLQETIQEHTADVVKEQLHQ
ncbi:MAG: CvpA family protein [Epsilonproteobacteria bacterium]|nr:CvpA family protein [Campylobacterota bacterium]